MQIERAVRLAAMQVDGYGSDGDVRGDQRIGKDLPAREVEQAAVEKTEHRLSGGMIEQVVPLLIGIC